MDKEMFRKIVQLTSLFLTLAASTAFAAPARDLFEYYPFAKDELVKFVACRAFYVSQHYNDPEPSLKISEKSSIACKIEADVLLEKIQSSADRYAFLNQIDILVANKVDQIRQTGIPQGPGPVWAKCVTDKVDMNELGAAKSRDAVNVVFGRAYAGCLPEEHGLLDSLSLRTSRSDAQNILKRMKQEIEEGLSKSLRDQSR